MPANKRKHGENKPLNIIEKDQFQKYFKGTRWKIYILSFLVAFVMKGIIRVFMNNSFENYMYIFIGSAAAVLCSVNLFRLCNQVNYNKDSYTKSARQYINKIFDKYTKRLINSMHIAVAGAFVELYIFLAAILSAGMTPWESFISLGIVVFILVKNILCKYAINRQYGKIANRRF